MSSAIPSAHATPRIVLPLITASPAQMKFEREYDSWHHNDARTATLYLAAIPGISGNDNTPRLVNTAGSRSTYIEKNPVLHADYPLIAKNVPVGSFCEIQEVSLGYQHGDSYEWVKLNVIVNAAPIGSIEPVPRPRTAPGMAIITHGSTAISPSPYLEIYNLTALNGREPVFVCLPGDAYFKSIDDNPAGSGWIVKNLTFPSDIGVEQLVQFQIPSGSLVELLVAVSSSG